MKLSTPWTSDVKNTDQRLGNQAGAGLEALNARQRDIVGLIMSKGFATVDDLARQYSVSTQTIRRDITMLSEMQIVQRFRGGAGRVGRTVRLGYAKKSVNNLESKQRIGRAIAAAIPDGSSVFLDMGTTVEAVASALASKERLRVITYSMHAAMHLAGRGNIDLFVTGGVSRSADGSLVGDVALRALSQFKVDFGVLGLSGFDTDGALLDFDMEKVALKRAVIEHSESVFVAVDSSKFSRKATTRVAPLSSAGVIFSEAAPETRLKDLFTAEGVRLVICD